MTHFTPQDEGNYLDSQRGRYQGEAIIQMALDHGWKTKTWRQEDFNADAEFYGEAIQAAEDYLNTLTPDGYYFGTTEGGDWGLWREQE